MSKSGIDQDALITMFSQATAKQGEALRQGVSDAVLKALQGRELTMKNIKAVLKTVTQAASTGAAQNTGVPDVEALLGKAFAGMDAALLQAVEANRRALQQFVDQGVGLSEKQLKSALDDIEKMESMFFSTVGKAVEASSEPLKGAWAQVLEAGKLKGTETGTQASQAVEQLMSRTQTALRDSRALGLRATQAMLDSYAALASGVLIGMSQALQQGGAAAPAPAAKSSRAK